MLKTNRLFVVCILLISFISINCDNFHVGQQEHSLNSINAIRTLQGQYAAKNEGQYASTFDELIKSFQLDERFSGEKPIVNGYIFEMKTKSPSAEHPAFFSITAKPGVGEEFQRSFYYDSTLGTIRYTEENRLATKDDPSI